MIEIIKSSAIKTSLKDNHRQYLIGNLKLPQELEHIYDEQIEMVITHFHAYSYEKPHFHSEVTEYQIILSGAAKYVDVGANMEYLVETGDVFVIRPNTIYIQKSIEGTQILFFKNPGKNDKVLIDMTDQMLSWSRDWTASW